MNDTIEITLQLGLNKEAVLQVEQLVELTLFVVQTDSEVLNLSQSQELVLER